MLDYINDMNMERSVDNEISKGDKIEYNLLLARVNKYSKLSKKLQNEHSKAFDELEKEIDKLIFEMGVDNASTEERKNGFKIEKGGE